MDTKLLTAEDPVEYELEGIMQVPVNHQVGFGLFESIACFPSSGSRQNYGGRNSGYRNCENCCAGFSYRTCRAKYSAYQ
jgi:hypothetical protein